jgi:SAM-dependent methyltransferase
MMAANERTGLIQEERVSNRRCPWWLGYSLANPLRGLIHRPQRMLAPYVRPGALVLEPGPGLGFFTLPLARLVGSAGRVVAVDVQERMLAGLRRRARAAQLDDRIDCRTVTSDRMDIDDLASRVDFVLVFWMAHEVRALEPFLVACCKALAADGTLLLAEPYMHVSAAAFAATVTAAEQVGLTVTARPAISWSRAACLRHAVASSDPIR